MTVFFFDLGDRGEYVIAVTVREVAGNQITGWVENGHYYCVIDTKLQTVGAIGQLPFGFVAVEAVAVTIDVRNYDEAIEWARQRRQNG